MAQIAFAAAPVSHVETGAAPSAPPAAALPRMPALDVLRAVGAVAVVATHVGFNTGASLSGFWGGFLARLDVGVAIFFVLSGFLLFRPFAHAAATGSRAPGARRYLWRRAVRILPAYWLAVAAFLLLIEQKSPVTGWTWLSHLSLTQVYPGTYASGFGHSWSLCTEVAFYLLLPLVAAAVLKGRWRPGRAVVILAVSGLVVTAGWVALQANDIIKHTPHGQWLPAYASWFGAGMALAAAHVALRTHTAPRSWQVLDELGKAPLACWTIAAALLAVTTTPLAGPRDLGVPTPAEFALKLVTYALIATLLLSGLAFGPGNRVTQLFSSAPSRWLGTISYGLFLWHPLILSEIYRSDGRPTFTGDFLTTFIFVLLGGIVLGAASYHGVERPLQRLQQAGKRRR